MANKVIKPNWTIDEIISEVTKFGMRNESRLRIIANGLDSDPIADLTVPPGKEWIVHIHLEVHELPSKKKP